MEQRWNTGTDKGREDDLNNGCSKTGVAPLTWYQLIAQTPASDLYYIGGPRKIAHKKNLSCISHEFSVCSLRRNVLDVVEDMC